MRIDSILRGNNDMFMDEIVFYDYEEILDEDTQFWLLKIEGVDGLTDKWFPKSKCFIHEGVQQVELPETLAAEKFLN